MTQGQPGVHGSGGTKWPWAALIRAGRPHQWVKNAFVVAPWVFAGPALMARDGLVAAAGPVALALIGFCLASSATYLLNDLHDLAADRDHPVKRLRPLASGALPETTARRAVAVLIAVALALALAAAPPVAGLTAAYLGMNVAYSRGLKRIAWVDAAVIATGFLLRVLAGAYAADVPLSSWLTACTLFLALFLALGKRRHELLTSGASHRPALGQYRAGHLDAALTVLALATSAAYLAYTLDPDTVARFSAPYLPATTTFAALGLWRFMALLRREDTAHSPTDRMLRDRLFIANLMAWGLSVLWLIYHVPERWP